MNFLFRLFIFLFLPGIFVIRAKTHSENSFTTINVESGLQNGDLIFRRGKSPESYAVLVSGPQCRFSHVGIICIENGKPLVIHAVPGENKKGPDFIKKEKISEFLAPKKASGYAVYRSDFPAEMNKLAAQKARQYYQNKLSFDNQYDLNSDDKMYCTELVLKAFENNRLFPGEIKTTEINFIVGKKQIVFPGNILENPHFFKLKNH